MTKPSRLAIVALLLTVVLASGWLTIRSSRDGNQNSRPSSKTAIEAARSPIIASLKDPGSAQFRSEILQPDGVTVCGEFNAKNSFGGYVGFVKYASNGNYYLIENGGFKTWPVHAVPVVAPDGYADAVEKATLNPDLMTMIKRDLWEWYWKSLCKHA